MSLPGKSEQAGRVRGVVRWVITSIIFLILIAASLFLSAGTRYWWMAWVYLGLAAAIQLLDALVLIPLSPDLLVERSRYQKGAKRWDQVLSRLMAIIGPLTIWILSGLDYRYSWSPETAMWLVIISAGFVFWVVCFHCGPWLPINFSLAWYASRWSGGIPWSRQAHINTFATQVTWVDYCIYFSHQLCWDRCGH